MWYAQHVMFSPSHMRMKLAQTCEKNTWNEFSTEITRQLAPLTHQDWSRKVPTSASNRETRLQRTHPLLQRWSSHQRLSALCTWGIFVSAPSIEFFSFLAVVAHELVKEFFLLLSDSRCQEGTEWEKRHDLITLMSMSTTSLCTIAAADRCRNAEQQLMFAGTQNLTYHHQWQRWPCSSDWNVC